MRKSVDPLESVWVAVRGKRTLAVAASSPEKLTEQVEAAARGEAGPDEGDKTQTWRALRKHRRGWRLRQTGMVPPRAGSWLTVTMPQRP